MYQTAVIITIIFGPENLKRKNRIQIQTPMPELPKA
jgi:hypothetical protein